MHPREVFIFSRRKYTAKIAERSDAELKASQSAKTKRIVANQKDMTLHIILVLLTHGGWVIFLLLELRSMDVARWKKALIENEIGDRQQVKAIQAAEQLRVEVEEVLDEVDRNDDEAFRRALRQVLTRDGGRRLVLLGDERNEALEDAPPPYRVAIEQEKKY